MRLAVWVIALTIIAVMYTGVGMGRIHRLIGRFICGKKEYCKKQKPTIAVVRAIKEKGVRKYLTYSK